MSTVMLEGEITPGKGILMSMWQDREDREKESTALFHAAMTELTGYMPGPLAWTIVEHEYGRWLTVRQAETGLGIQAHLDPWKQRIEFSGDYPEAKREHHDIINYARSRCDFKTSPSIGVSLTKKPAAMAKDIERRLFQDVIRMAQAVRDIRAEHDAYENSGKTNIQRVAAILRKDAPKNNGLQDSDKKLSFDLGPYHMGEGYGNVECRGDKVEIRIRSINIELAEQVLKVLTGQA